MDFALDYSNEEENVKVVVEQKYAEGLNGLEGYSHVQILWWMMAVTMHLIGIHW